MVLLSLPARAATADEIEQAISRAKQYLYSQQNDGGTWERTSGRTSTRGDDTAGDQWGGLTAIATYALLASGEKHHDPKLKPAIEFLQNADVIGIYALGMRCQVWGLLPQSEQVRALLKKDADALLVALKTKGGAAGMYDYVNNGPGGRFDHSVSQYGVLGMWACAEAGVEVPVSYWKAVQDGWLKHQVDGGWSYYDKPRNGRNVDAAMTAAGVATLFITQDYLQSAQSVQCRGNAANAAIEKGMKWLDDHFDEVLSRRSLYTLYGIERVGVAGGHKYFGSTDWFREGADYLVRTQKEDGSWNTGYGTIADTSFGVLFLTRGRAPVVINKLQYDLATRDGSTPGHWNQRPRDVANVVKWVGRQNERELNWQIVNLDVPVEELHDAPILYLSGNQVLSFSEAQQAKLKQYVEEGGLLLGNADCGGAAFANSFKRLGESLFDGCRFRELPADHPIYMNQSFKRHKWRMKPAVLGLSNGVRELMILIPTADAGRFWQLRDPKQRPEVFELAANLVLYATDKQVSLSKGQSHHVVADESTPVSRTIRLARLKYLGPWDPEPAGWRRLAAILRNEGIELKVEVAELGKQELSGFDVAHLTGTGKLRLSEKERNSLQRFVRSGGTLIVDAAGGSKLFAESAEEELIGFFGAAGLHAPLPPDDPFYASSGISRVGYREFARMQIGHEHVAPLVRGLRIDGRLGVFFSPLDLSAGLVGQPVDGVLGYTPESSVTLVRAMIGVGATPASPSAGE